MKNLFNTFFGSFFEILKKGFKEIAISYQRLTLRILIVDFISVAMSIGFVIIPAFLVGTILILLPQGRDTLLLVVEKLSIGSFWQLLFLVCSTGIWGVVSELATRYAIYITDVSGRNLNEKRIKWRKTVQKMLAAFFLLWPPFIIIIGLIWSFFTATYMKMPLRLSCFGVCILALLLLMVLLSNKYFRKMGAYAPGVFRKTTLGERSLSNEEQSYLRRLYGIYDDYVFSLPKASSFLQPYKSLLESFTDSFKKADSEGFINGFPQNEKVLIPIRKVPESFELISHNLKKGEGEYYRWTYQIPGSFYQGLHRQIIRMALWSLVVLLIFACIPAEWPMFGIIGAPGLLCLAVSCYSGLYIGLLYLDKSYGRHWLVSLRFCLLVLYLGTSYFNQDHPVRMSKVPPAVRKDMVGTFEEWFIRHKAEISKQYPDTAGRKYPVVFICAEGGALRTGAYTSLFLTRLEQRLSKEQQFDFKGSIFAMSGVSGGAYGLGFYHAINFHPSAATRSTAEQLLSSERFFKYDPLSPLLGKMLFGDFLNLFIPWHIEGLDRAIALEKSWEQAYESIRIGDEPNLFKGDFLPQGTGFQPMLVINTTEIETGLQCWVTNMAPRSLLFNEERDLFAHKMNGLSYSTALNFSSRFPIFSPAAKINGPEGTKLHYLDGGYVENSGAAAMLEILQLLKQSEQFKEVTPIVLHLLFSEEDMSKPDISFFNDGTEIFYGLYSTRPARRKISRQQMRQFVEHEGGRVIDAPLTPKEKEVPMNWVLSDQSMNNILEDIDRKLSDSSAQSIVNKMLMNDLKFIKH